MSTLADDFLELARADTARERWAHFATTMPAVALPLLLPLLTTSHAGTLDLGIIAGFRALTRVSAGFRSEVAKHIASMVPGQPSRPLHVLLRSLVDGCREDTAQREHHVFAALVTHRGYRDPVTNTTMPDLGADVRSCLDDLLARFNAGPPEALVSPFRFVLMNAPAVNQPDFGVWSDEALKRLRAWDRAFRGAVLDALLSPRTRQSLHWLDVPDAEQPLLKVQEALLRAYHTPDFSGDLHGSIGDALQLHIERCSQLWRDEYAEWQPVEAENTRFDVARCRRAETLLHLALERLRSLQGGSAEPGIMDGAAVDAYHAWVELCGGWDRAQLADPATSPRPAWLRDWRAAEGRARGMNLLEAIAPHAFIRLFDRLRVPSWDPGADYLDPSAATNVDVLLAMAGEIEATGRAQGLTSCQLLDGAPVPPGKTPRPAFLLPCKTHPRYPAEAPLHPDHRRAARIVLAAFYAWRADIAYRTAGPKWLAEGFSASQQRELKRARVLYEAVAALLADPLEANSWRVGLGLFGRILDIERGTLVTEYQGRLAQIDSGADYTSAELTWPSLYAWQLLDRIEHLLTYSAHLQHTTIDLPAERAALDDNVRLHEAAHAAAAELAGAAEQFAAAEEFAGAALAVAANRQELRIKIAEHRRGEARWHTAALTYATKAAESLEQAEAALKVAVDLEVEQLGKQIEALRQNIDTLRAELPTLRRDIEAAQKELAALQKSATAQHQRKQSQRALITVIKRVGSLVSIYYTGVDLVAVAETAMNAVDAVQSGDWPAALGDTLAAGNQLTNNMLSAFFEEKLGAAERYLASTMPDSLAGATECIAKALKLDGDTAVHTAVAAVSQQAFRVGVSVLADEAHVRTLVGKLGVTASSERVRELSALAVKMATDTAARVFTLQGPAVLARAKGLLGIAPDAELAVGIGARVFAVGGESYERSILSMIQGIQNADIAALKASLLEGREELVQSLARTLKASARDISAALDGVTNSAANATQTLPSAPLPADVIKLLRSFRSNVDGARARLGFLLAEGAAERLSNKLADIDDDQQFQAQLGGVVVKLNDAVSTAVANTGVAGDDLEELREALARLTTEALRKDILETAQEWRTKAAAHQIDYQIMLEKAAAESVLAAEQQITVEELGRREFVERQREQKQLGEARQSEARAAAYDLQVREFALKRAMVDRTRWHLLHQAPGEASLRLLTALRLRALDQANTALIQAWQLVMLFEPPARRNTPWEHLRPTFLAPSRETIAGGMRALIEARREWNHNLLEGMRLLSSLTLKDLVDNAANLPKELEPVLKGYLSLNSRSGDALVVGPEDLVRLKNGFSFQVSPRSVPPGACSAAAVSLQALVGDTTDTPAPLFVAPRRVRPWNDEGARRLRLFGVVALIKGGVPAGREGEIRLYLVQESDAWLVVAGNDGTRKVGTPLPRMVGFDPLGLMLEHGKLETLQFQTRPFFGTYTLRIGPKSLQIIEEDGNPEQFCAELHFVVVGTHR